MPTLVTVVAVDLHELLEYCAVAASALGGKTGRVVEVAVNVVFVFIIGVLRTKNGRADGACEVLDVVLLVCRTVHT